MYSSLTNFKYGKIVTLIRKFSSTSRKPINTIINFVPHQQAWIVERFGKFYKVLDPGLNYLLPIVDDIKYTQSLKETAIEIPSQTAITEDNVTLNIDGVLYYRIEDPYLASYGVEDGEYAVVQLAQTTMRSELGKIKLDKVFQERASLNLHIVEAINQASSAWGICCLRYEIKDISIPIKVKEAMQMMVEAERKKRARILESEGVKESAINIANGEKQARILHSEAEKIEKINIAIGKAESAIRIAEGESKAIELISKVLQKDGGSNAASLSLGKQYVSAFNQLAKETNTMLLPMDSSNVTSIVSQALAIYKNFFLEKNKKSESFFKDSTNTSNEHSVSSHNHITDTTSVSAEKTLDNGVKNEMSIFDSTTRQF